MVKKVKRKIPKRKPKGVYIFRRIIVLAILFIIIGSIGLLFSKLPKEGNSFRKLYNKKLAKYKIEEIRLDLDIEEKEYQWDKGLQYTNKPKAIVIHHSGFSKDSVENIDNEHKSKGWSGIGYHYFITKEGKIIRGRPEKAIGAHALGKNKDTIGICVEGNYENELIEEKAYNSLINLISYVSLEYSIEDIWAHGDVYSTLCPGKNLKVSRIKEDFIEKFKKINTKD